MIGENPFTATDIDVVDGRVPSVTPLMTKFFRRLCNRAQGHSISSEPSSSRNFMLILDRARDPTMQAGDAAVGWLPVSDSQGNFSDAYKGECITEQQAAGETSKYLLQWRGVSEDHATREPAERLRGSPALLHAWRRRLARAPASALLHGRRPTCAALKAAPSQPPRGPLYARGCATRFRNKGEFLIAGN
ncbi:uncharacterized protein EMH_0071910 [Eimeria mitis]|uniref:Chromo domain-containing protein n=1 Tax=Eimeria mitis TaxID=44415 RepID=U6KFW8_9EIME|nr:uncharacterized protein EMH_0071910 [Eimeria mitis]CDJ35157.1 hypothetical protein EMH_0071910 [Eimeria mitis]